MKKVTQLGVLSAVLCTSIASQAATLDDLDRKVSQLTDKISQEEDRFRINGFASFGIVQSDNEASYHRGITDEPNFRRYTKMGVQMSFKIDDDTSVITQLVSKGETDFVTKAEWLYLKHDFGDGFTGKIGRLRKPNYLLSEFFDVGYAMPWTQPPVEVYGVLEDSANYEALDLTYDFELMDWTSYVQVQYGRSETETAVSKDLVAVNFSMNKDEWTLRTGYSQADVTLKSGTDLSGQIAQINAAYANTNKSSEVMGDVSKGTFMGAAVAYDDGVNMVISEFNSLKVDSYFPDQQGYYVVYGRRFGSVMPYVTLAHNETTDDDDRSAVANSGLPANSIATINGGVASAEAAFNKEQDRTSFGVRYDYKPGVAIKVQYDMVDTHGTKGEFAAVPSDDTANILSLTIDTVF